jgi:hypothetical protein
MEYGLKSATRFLANRERLFLFEKTILKYIRQLSALDPNLKTTDVLLEFRNEITEIVQDKYEKQALSLFNILSWIDARLSMTNMWHIDHSEAIAQKQEK